MIFEEVCILRNCYKSYFWKATENVSSCQTVQPPHFLWTLPYCLKSWSSVHELWRLRGGKVSERINLNKPQRHFREIFTFHRAYAEISSLKTNEDVSHYTYAHKSDALFLILMHRSNTRKWDVHSSFPLSGRRLLASKGQFSCSVWRYWDWSWMLSVMKHKPPLKPDII